ncbi:DUF4455 domain-containing protein [Chloropicon primus]|uniref:DUF4455 domain-containing protein n=1 Tax=Chloropicon primus TaxID=1764295 RepID=A0A5B8MQ86_9CHLO|nr:DUF4455 domain-containing protein [Chloropicon primus]UPR02082.1 DUF4455 domain-containing protein [Chloropicon primus]|eukprot:QDZ22858.1 DUF4455 domain-containing protein [Chloropicon primus]
MERIPNLDAGQSLLASLNGRRARIPKVDKQVQRAKDEKYVPNHAIPIEELVLRNPMAEVHSLPERLGGKAATKLEGVERMVSSKEQRHANSQALLEQKLLMEDQRHKKHIQDQIRKFEKKLKSNTEHIEALFVNLEEDKIICMEEGMFREIGEEIMLQSSVRQGWIDDLGETLKGLESKRRKTTEGLLLNTLGDLVDIAYLSEGSLQRFLEKKILETNFNMLENSKVYAELQRRLRTAEVIKEKKCKEALDEGLEKWRQLRTQHAIECFKERVKSKEIYDPIQRSELFVRITDKQAKIYQALELNLASVADMLPPHNMEAAEKNVSDWLETILSNIETWQNQTMKIVERLWYEEDKLKTKVAKELDNLKSDILGYGALNEEETSVALEQNCMVVVKERELYASGLITKCTECLERQYTNWRKTCTVLGDFLASVIGSQEKQTTHLKAMEDAVRSDMRKCRSDFAEANTKREDDLESARNEISQSNTDIDLEKHVEVALERLDGIEEGYRGFHKDMLELVHAYPVNVNEADNAHWNSICKLLYIKTEEDDSSAPEPQPEAEDQESADKPPAEEAEEGEGGDSEEETKETEVVLEPLEVYGKPYELSAEIYGKLFADKPEAEESAPEEENEGEESEEPKEENEEDEGSEAESPKKKEEVQLEIPDPIEEVVVQEKLIREILQYTQKEILHHIEVSTRENMTLISTWSTRQEEHLTDELDSRLRSHRPRAGRIEEEDREFRSVELAGQRRRFDRHLRKAVHALKMNNQNYENEVLAIDSRFNQLYNKIKNAEAHLSTTASVKGLDIRIRESQKLKTRLISDVKHLIESSKEVVGNNTNAYLDLNAKFCDDNFKNETTAASYGAQTIQKSTAQLEALDKEAKASLETQIKHLDEKEVQCIEKIESAYTEFESMTEPHREDLGLLESVDACLNQAKSKLRSEFGCSYSISKEISDRIGSLDMLKASPSEKPEQAFNQLLSEACSGIYSLDMLLLFYCGYLQCMKSELNGQQMLEDLNKMEEERGLKPTSSMQREEFFTSETLKAAVDNLIGESKQNLIKTAEAYYGSKKSIEEITRKNRIPNDVKTMKEEIENILTDLNDQANEHSSSMLMDVRELIIMTSRCLERVPAKIMKEFVKNQSVKVKEKLGVVLAEFKGEFEVMKRERNEHEKSLRPSLANPLLKNEFELLCSEEENRSKECRKVLRTFATKILEVTHEQLGLVNSELHKVTKMLAVLLDNVVFIEDIDTQEQLKDVENINAKHLISLRRYEAFKNSEATRTEVKGRQFKVRTWDDVTGFALEEIGWSGTLSELLGDTPEEGEEDKTFEMEKGSENLKSFETPQAFALIVTRNRAIKDLKKELTGTFGTIIDDIKGCIYEENEWQKKWPRMLEGLNEL